MQSLIVRWPVCFAKKQRKKENQAKKTKEKGMKKEENHKKQELERERERDERHAAASRLGARESRSLLPIPFSFSLPVS